MEMIGFPGQRIAESITTRASSRSLLCEGPFSRHRKLKGEGAPAAKDCPRIFEAALKVEDNRKGRIVLVAIEATLRMGPDK